MKTTIINKFLITVTGTAAIALFAISLTAGEIPTAKGGASKTVSIYTPAAPAAAAPAKAMACSTCKDTTTTVRDASAKGATVQLAGAPVKTVSTHMCGSCTTDWVVKTAGKATTSTAVHGCGSCN